MPYAEAGAWGSAVASSLARRPARTSAMPRLLHLLQAILLLATPGLVTLQAICPATTMEDLFPRERPAGSLDITRQLFNAVATNYSLLVPSPTAGFTLFATSDAGYAKSQQGPRAQAVQHMLNMPPEQLATWVLYSFSYLALPPDKLMPDIPTELQARTLNTSYVISASSSPPNLMVEDLLSVHPDAGAMTVTDMYQVCSSYVYVLDSVIWPSDDPASVPPTDLSLPNMPAIWPGAASITFSQTPSGAGALRAQLIQLLDKLLNLPPGTEPGATLTAQAQPPGPGPKPKSGSSTGAIVGGVVGGVGGAILLTGVVWVLARRFYRHSHLEAMGSDPPSSDPESGKLGKAWTEVTAHAWGKPQRDQVDSARSMNGEGLAKEGSDRQPEVEMIDWDISPEAITICQAPDGSDRLWELGSGGFGVVYKAMLDGATPVAVKFVTNQSFKEQERFKREVAILKSLRHVNIVQFLGAATAGDRIMLCQEFMPKGDLWRALAQDRTGQLGWYNRGRGIALDVVRGVLHMHARRIIHLDLKTANILLGRDGKAKVADVGLAKILTREHTQVSMDGTFEWSAPEVLAGQCCSEAADIWSLAVVLWEIVTGERPHRRQMRPIRVPEECPAEVRDLVQHCLSLDPGARPTSMQVYDRLNSSPKGPGPDQAAPAALERSNPAGSAHRPSSSSDTHSRASQPSAASSAASTPQQEGASHAGALDDLPFGYVSPFAQQSPHSGQVTVASMLKSHALATRRSRARQENTGSNQPGSARFSSQPSATSVGSPVFGYQSPFQQVAEQGWAPSTQPSQGQSSSRTAGAR